MLETNSPSRYVPALTLATLCFFLAGCAAEIQRQPTTLNIVHATHAGELRTIKQDTHISLQSGYYRLIRKDSQWKHVGSIAQGQVYAASGSTFSIEGAHVHEAYLVVAKGNLIGFYLPVEKSFAPFNSSHVVNLWEEK